MPDKENKKSKAGMPSNIELAQGLTTNNITSTPETTHRSGKIEDNAWWNDPDVDERIDDYVEKELANTKDEFTGQKKEVLDGQRGESKGNQGDNDLAYNNYEDKFMPTNGGEQLITMLGGDQGEVKSIAPKPENTPGVTERHKEELAQLQNALGTGEPVSGTIIQTPSLGEEAEVEEEGENPDGGNSSGDGSGDKSGESELPKAPEEANLDFSDYIKNYYGPKNGADYLKSLWSQGVGGKAAAIGNVLGNILGAAGKGLAGQDYTSDWQTYKDNYTKEMAERNQKAFDQNMSIANQLRTNDVARNELLKVIENYQKIGKGLTPEKFENIRKALTATGKSSQLDYYLSYALGELASDPEFMKQLTSSGKNASSLISGVTQLADNAVVKPLNFVTGGLNKATGWAKDKLGL